MQNLFTLISILLFLIGCKKNDPIVDPKVDTSLKIHITYSTDPIPNSNFSSLDVKLFLSYEDLINQQNSVKSLIGVNLNSIVFTGLQDTVYYFSIFTHYSNFNYKPGLHDNNFSSVYKTQKLTKSKANVIYTNIATNDLTYYLSKATKTYEPIGTPWKLFKIINMLSAKDSALTDCDQNRYVVFDRVNNFLVFSQRKDYKPLFYESRLTNCMAIRGWWSNSGFQEYIYLTRGVTNITRPQIGIWSEQIGKLYIARESSLDTLILKDHNSSTVEYYIRIK